MSTSDGTSRTPGRVWVADDRSAMVWGIGQLRPTDAELAWRAVMTGYDPVAGPSTAWAAVVIREDGSLAAAVSTNFLGGLFWADDPQMGLTFSDHVGDLICSLSRVPSLEAGYLRAFAVLDVQAQGTPYEGVHRIGGGTTAVWYPTSTSPRVVRWCGPDAWPEPTLRGSQVKRAYLEAFDKAVDAAAPAEGPLAATLSGGLDSTFAVASLTRHATPARPIHAFCHTPRSEAQMSNSGNWDADDLPFARIMAERYPGLIRVIPVVAPDHQTPLDAANAAARTSWIPTYNPGNQVWLNLIAKASGEIGAQATMTGAHGNASFSHDHQYALRHHLSRLQVNWARRCVADKGRTPLARHIRSQIASPLLSPAAARIRGTNTWLDYQRSAGLGHVQGRAFISDSRAKFLSFLQPGAGHGAALGGARALAPVVDPFTARDVLDLAARITPVQWRQGPGGRGLARMLGAGRVPDEIRLRTRRGAQAWDEWFLMRHQRQRYSDEISMLTQTPILGGWVDHEKLRRTHESLPWGQVAGPAPASIHGLNRILSIAAFVRMTSTRLDTLRAERTHSRAQAPHGVFRDPRPPRHAAHQH